MPVISPLRRLSILLLAWAAASPFGASHALADNAERKPGYRVVVPNALALEVGAEAQLSIAIVPAEGFHIDRNGPIRIDLSVAKDSGLQIKKQRLRRSDALESSSEEPRFTVALVSSREGQEALTVEYRFWLCRTKICHPVRGGLEVELQARAASTESPVGDAGPAALAIPR